MTAYCGPALASFAAQWCHRSRNLDSQVCPFLSAYHVALRSLLEGQGMLGIWIPIHGWSCLTSSLGWRSISGLSHPMRLLSLFDLLNRSTLHVTRLECSRNQGRWAARCLEWLLCVSKDWRGDHWELADLWRSLRLSHHHGEGVPPARSRIRRCWMSQAALRSRTGASRCGDSALRTRERCQGCRSTLIL